MTAPNPLCRCGFLFYFYLNSMYILKKIITTLYRLLAKLSHLCHIQDNESFTGKAGADMNETLYISMRKYNIKNIDLETEEMKN